MVERSKFKISRKGRVPGSSVGTGYYIVIKFLVVKKKKKIKPSMLFVFSHLSV